MGILWNGSKPSNILWSTGMNYVERNLGPINTWTIPSTTTDVVSYSGTNTISLNGKGGHYETCYKSFTVSKSGSYTISYDYDLPTINFYGTSSSHMHFGIYITTNQPPGGDMPTYSDYSTGNCNGTDICGPSSQYNTPGTGHISFNYTLTAGTTYYLWIPMMNLADGVQTYLTFTNLNVKSVEQYYNTVEPELWLNGSKIWPEMPPLVIDLNGKGRELTSEWYSQTKYPGVWSGLRIFSSGTAINGSYSPSGTYTTFIRNIEKLSSNFTLLYLPDCRNSTSYGYGRGTYLADNTQLFYNTCPYGSGQDSNQPRYNKSKYYSVAVNASKGGDIQMYFYTRATWYTNTLYYAIPEELVGKVINSL